MAKIIIAIKAKNSFKSFVEYSCQQFGRKALLRFREKVTHKINQLQKYPLTGSPEPLLSNYTIQFRSCVVQKPVKMVYHYVEETDTIYIDNFWDMRRNPDALKGDI